MSEQSKGTYPATTVVDSPVAAGRTRATLKLKVEKLGVAFHTGTRVRFTYHSEITHSTILVNGLLEHITRGAPGQPTILRVDRLSYHVPAGTLITVETGELR